MARNEVVDRDLGWKKMVERVEEMRDARVKVGVIGDAADEREEGSDLTVGEIALVNEFGTEDGHIPSRSFVRSTFDREQQRLATMAKGLSGQILDGKIGVKQALGVLGASLVSSIRAIITGGVAPPNAPSTVMRKLGRFGGKVTGSGARGLGRALSQVGRAASVKPLINTGRMLNALSWMIDDGE